MSQMWPTYHNVIISYYHNILITCTQIQPFQKSTFYKYAHKTGTRGSPDMLLSAFDVKFHEKKDEIPPSARRPSTSEEKKQCAGYWHTTVNK